MLKKIIYTTVLLALLTFATFLVAIAPYHIYTLSLTEGVNTRFLQMTPTPKALYDGQIITLKNTEMMIDKNFYEKIHFNNFVISIPINHPQFSLIPTIKIEAAGPRLGASFQNSKNIEFFNFMIERPYKFETTYGDQKLFILPIFKNYISKKNNQEIWNDLFEKKLSLPSNEGRSFFDSLKTLYNVKYQDLVYNLYILYNRRFLAPDETNALVYHPEKKIGIVELSSPNKKMRIERLFIIENGLLYPIVIKTKIGEFAAENFRSKFISEISYKHSSTDSAIPIYARYKQLNFSNRTDQTGMTFLFSAWSHDLSNKDFVRVIILFLERGKLNLKFLKPFYEFAYKKFGSTLSSESGYLEETSAESLKRKISEDLEKEIKKETDLPVVKTDENFSSGEEKVKFNLQKAKDLKINSDEADKILTIE